LEIGDLSPPEADKISEKMPPKRRPNPAPDEIAAASHGVNSVLARLTT